MVFKMWIIVSRVVIIVIVPYGDTEQVTSRILINVTIFLKLAITTAFLKNEF